MSDYEAVYEELFTRNLRRYSSIRQPIKRRIDRVLTDPYHNTEFLSDTSGKLNLIGCRSARVDRNFRIIFVICKECRNIQECEFCFCENLLDKIVDKVIDWPYSTFRHHVQRGLYPKKPGSG